MCNLYAMTSSQAAIVDLLKIWRDEAGNMPPFSAIYPDYTAPVVTQSSEGRVLRMMRWGMPTPARVLGNKQADKGVTNIRNTASLHWRRWLGIENRCVVPFTSFSEYYSAPGGRSQPVWFASPTQGEMLFFAGIWTNWTSVRKVKEGETTNDLFGFLTAAPNAVVAPYHPKAMPVILRSPEAISHWLTAPTKDALRLQRPFDHKGLQVIEAPI